MDHKLRRQYIVTRNKKDIIAIAHEIYGSGGMAGKILRENPGVYQLKSGMVLNLPENIPQKAIAADQSMRLDFAGLRNDHLPDIGTEPEDEAEIVIDKEQLASEIIGLLRENGVLERKVVTGRDAQRAVGDPKNCEMSISGERLSNPLDEEDEEQENENN